MSKMRILTLDIETSPNLVYAWGIWQQNISINQIVKPTYVMSWAAKWLDKKTVMYKSCNDKGFLEDIWALLDEADAVVHFNGTAFDMKHLHREFVEAGMDKPLMPVNIDLLNTVRYNFKYPSNKLDYVAGRLLGEHKFEHTGMQLWLDCMNGKKAAWKMMKDYNKQDVVLTERLYLKLRGWIKGHPNHGLYVEDQENPVCRNCGSEHVHSQGWQRLNVNSYQRYRCSDCGAQMRGRKRVSGGKNSKQIVL
jgi:DNA polymerase elongation subunit (family B)